MKTILLPIDFSNTSKNAAQYALALAKQTGATKIVLYHTYEVPINIASDVMIPVDFIDPLELKKITEDNLRGVQIALQKDADSGIVVETLCELNTLTDGIDAAAKLVHADAIIMGITGGGVFEEKLIGSNTISVARTTTVPVIIVPLKSQFSTIKNVLLVSDFKEVAATTPVDKIKKILDETSAKLHIYNVDEFADENDVVYASTLLQETHDLHALFESYHPNYSYSNSSNFVEAINEYALQIDANLIVVIPKKHGWFDSLFKESHTKQLAFHSNIPLMVVHK